MMYNYASFQFIPSSKKLALLLSYSRTEAITHVPRIVTYVAVEKGMELKGEQR